MNDFSLFVGSALVELDLFTSRTKQAKAILEIITLTSRKGMNKSVIQVNNA